MLHLQDISSVVDIFCSEATGNNWWITLPQGLLPPKKKTLRFKTSVVAKMAENCTGDWMWSHVITSKVVVETLDSNEYNQISMS